MWIDDPAKWARLAERLRAAGEFGIDTETYGQPDRTSPQHRARIHCWSVGVLGGSPTARGYRRATGVVLPRAALDSPDLRAVLADPAVAKWAHNAPHDRHALNNEDVCIQGLQDSLQWFRVAIPGMSDYGLKAVERWALGYPARPEFWDLMKYEVTEYRAKRSLDRFCSCNSPGCRLRRTGHSKHSLRRFTPIPRQVPMRYTVPDFLPSAKLVPLTWTPGPGSAPVTLDRMAAWWAYSLADATRGMEAVDWLRNRRTQEVKYPWRRVV